MSTRTRHVRPHEDTGYQDTFEEGIDLDSLSDDELEALLFEEEKPKPKKGLLNLPTMAGLSIIVVGIVYLFQQLGLVVGLPSLEAAATMLPWLAGVLIILLGFGVLSWRPSKKKKKTVRKEVKVKTGETFTVEAGLPAGSAEKKKRLRKSLRDRKVAGVAGGLGEYLNIDPTIIRIAFVIGAFIGPGVSILLYLALAMIMSKPEPLSAQEKRINIIKDT